MVGSAKTPDVVRQILFISLLLFLAYFQLSHVIMRIQKVLCKFSFTDAISNGQLFGMITPYK